MVIVALEQMAAQTWFAPYYRFGIPIFFLRVPPERQNESALAGNPAAMAGTPAAAAYPDSASVVETLQPRFTNHPQRAAVQFKALSAQRMAFRERLFDNRAVGRYLPVFHSALQIQPGVYRITGYLNWYVIFIVVYLILQIQQDRSYGMIAAILAFVFGLSYLTQAAINRSVAEALRAEE